MPLYERCYGSIFLLVIVQTVNIADGTLPYENKELYKIKLDPTRFQFSDVFRQRSKLSLMTVSPPRDRSILNKSVTESTCKKWQVGRVSRKQYEIINMLWRKTKEFIDVETTTAKYYAGHSLHKLSIRSNLALTSPTSSFIEFYYLDENEERIKSTTRKHQLLKDGKGQQFMHLDSSSLGLADDPIFAFRLNNPNYFRLMLPTKRTNSNDNTIRRNTPTSLPYSKLEQKISKHFNYNSKMLNEIVNKITNIEGLKPKENIDDDTCLYTTETITTLINGSAINKTKTNPNNSINRNEQETTMYDRIKFFELYDKNTPLPLYTKEEKSLDLYDIEKVISGNKLSNDQRNLLEQIDQTSTTQHDKTYKAKHAKKHIIEKNKCEIKRVEKDTLNNIDTFNKTLVVISNKTKEPPTRAVSNDFNESYFTSPKQNIPKIPILTESNDSVFRQNAMSRVAKWLDYSYMAAYIYEPSQVHCDAAGISAHWLVTSGSCLSRHHKNPGVGGRSAFVSYCGSFWWRAERIAYVKYSVVHPRYQHRDTSRRNMYNIGLIQVVTSMSSCPGWAPLTLMPHHFAAAPTGSIAQAVGWGLDRYDTHYSSADLPKYSLMVYEGRVYLNSCPGHSDYNEAKNRGEENRLKNVYCLSLPPYLGEETDQIHGVMLLVEGKLIALYLQEERRPIGEQSALYTGTWRLAPWVSDVAREPEDSEPFRFSI